MGTSASLIAALISQLALPELLDWLRSRTAAGSTITDADIIAKLQVDTEEGIRIGTNWLTANPKL
jgi:hypothetical protein